jgi:hypothetical protein
MLLRVSAHLRCRCVPSNVSDNGCQWYVGDSALGATMVLNTIATSRHMPTAIVAMRCVGTPKLWLCFGTQVQRW